ncbi:hypothetical protein KAR91_01035 [Candidatus Pacearchaeota archaeon]|nr:hypothetical protein [Candidatus Pacearchaeota archaeon]
MTEEKPTWKNRRRYMLAVSLFCAATITYVLATQLDTKPAETAVMFAFLTLAGIVGSYVFGAVWEHVGRK